MEIKSGVSAEAVNQKAAHILFVEGSGENAIDPRALTRLLRDTDIAVRALGPSFSVKSAAQALHRHHPNYYFVIDRDHHDDAAVDDAWANFPNPATYNLLDLPVLLEQQFVLKILISLSDLIYRRYSNTYDSE